MSFPVAPWRMCWLLTRGEVEEWALIVAGDRRWWGSHSHQLIRTEASHIFLVTKHAIEILKHTDITPLIVNETLHSFVFNLKQVCSRSSFELYNISSPPYPKPQQKPLPGRMLSAATSSQKGDQNTFSLQDCTLKQLLQNKKHSCAIPMTELL